MNIFIPSRGRAGKLTTPYILPKELWKRMNVVVRPDEYYMYHIRDPKLPLLKLDKGVNGLSATRQWIIDQAKDRIHVQIDDDLTGWCWKPKSDIYGGVYRLTDKESHSRVLRALEQLERWINEGYAQVGISERYMAARPSPKPYYDNNRLGQFVMYDLRVIKNNKLRFDRVKLMQDLDMNLQLIRLGYPSRVLTRLCYVAKPEDYAGGVSAYRNDTLKKRMCLRIERLHKGLVQYKTKIKFGRTYHHLRTSWRKAYAHDK